MNHFLEQQSLTSLWDTTSNNHLIEKQKYVRAAGNPLQNILVFTLVRELLKSLY